MTNSVSSPMLASAECDWLLAVHGEPVLQLLSEFRHDGLEMVTVNDGAAALAAVAAAARELGLILIDLVMSGMDGLMLVRQFRERGVRSRLVIISGYLSDLITWPAELKGVGFQAKPFPLQEIRALLERISPPMAARS